MAIVNTSGTLDASTASTGTMVPLSGKAEWIYLSVYAQTYFRFVGSTGTTGSGTSIGLTVASGDTYPYQVKPGEAKYFLHVATGALPYYIMEVY